jgi:hypothetical protein
MVSESECVCVSAGVVRWESGIGSQARRGLVWRCGVLRAHVGRSRNTRLGALLARRVPRGMNAKWMNEVWMALNAVVRVVLFWTGI